MSVFKKLVSVVLCIAMLIGSPTVFSGLVTPDASAADDVSGVKTYEELAARYNNFIYLASEVYEIETTDGTLSGAVTDRVLTDYYVDAGQLLEERFYIKGDFYFGNSQFVKAYDNSFFDVTQITTTGPDSTGYSKAYTGLVNSENPVVAKNDIQNMVTSGACATEGWMKNRSGYTSDQLKVIDYVQSVISYSGNKSDKAYVFDDNIWLVSWVYKVKDGLADGTTGYSKTYPGFWNCSDATADKPTSTWVQRRGTINIASRPADDELVYVIDTKTSYLNYALIEAFLFDDLEHNFTIGANPNDAPAGPAGPVEGTSKIKSYAELAAQYDNFIYLASEVYEIETADGTLSTAVTSATLTDYYVDAGQLLEERFYIKGDFYFGNSQFIKAYDNSFFDVAQITTQAVDTTGYSTGYTGVVNPENPVVIKNDLENMVTSADCATEGWMKNRSGYTADELAVIDYVQSVITFSGNKSDAAYVFDDDVWLVSWVYKVKDGLVDGTTGYSKTLSGFWNCDDATAENRSASWMQRRGMISIALRPADATEADDNNTFVIDTKSSYVNYGLIETFLFDDLEHNFTIGANPNTGTVVKKYAVTFLENDGTEISSVEYVKDAEVPVPAAVEGQIGWADTLTGELADLTEYTVTRKAEFKRVLDTDEFTVTLNVDGGAVDAEALPDNASVDNSGNIVVKAGFNEEIDLSEIPAPEKEGYTGAWDAETVTIDNIKGKTAKVVWTVNTYKATFLTNRDDAEAFAVKDVAYGATVSCKAEKDGFKFAGWVDAETGEVVTTADRFAYKFASDRTFYAQWTEYNSSITFMIRDYENGSGWKVAAAKYGDEGTTLSKNDINNVLSKIEAENGVTVSKSGILTFIYNDEELSNYVDITSGVAYDGNPVLYVGTIINFNITWKVPVYANGAPTGEFTTTSSTVKTAMSGKTGIYSTFAKTDANTTAPGGFTFKGWKNEKTGEAVEYTANGVVIDGTFARELVFVADFQEAKYTLIFNINNGDFPDKLTLNKTFKLGDAVTLDGTVTNEDGKEVSLPVIGKENSELETPFIGMYGYEFKGWKVGTGANEADVTFPVDELTAEMIENYASGETITVYGQWEALEYELRFFYAAPDSDLSLPVEERKYTDEPIVVKYKTGETIRLILTGENLQKVLDNTPEGYTFYNFRQLAEGVVNTMPAGGLDVYARYTSKSIKIYVDYNNGKTDENGESLPLKDTLAETPLTKLYPVYCGDDLERAEDVENGIPFGTGTLITRSYITDGDRPGKNYEVVGWNVYHVDEGDDVYDKANWKPGINDEGTTIAKTTIVYQPKWKHHSQFIFGVYGTDGKLYMALGKDLRFYYWNNNYVCKRGDTSLNKDRENLVILFLKFSFRDASGFPVRIEPFYAPRSMFTFKSMLAFFNAIGNLIEKLF